MRRRVERESLGAGNESFLDVVANMVGILIILVMVVGVRTGNAPLPAAKTGASQPSAADDLPSMAQAARSLERDVLKLALAIEEVRRQTVGRSVERGELAFLVADRYRDLDEKRSAMAAQEQKAFDLRRETSLLASELEQTRGELDRIESAPKEVVRIDSFPTPLARPVDEHEAHFQIRGGRIVYIPLDHLLGMLKQSAQQDVRKLRNTPQVKGVVGPVGGFRMRYTLQQVVVKGRLGADGTASGTYGTFAQLSGWDLLPTSNQLGEPLEVALAPDSQFRAATAGLDPRRATITLWSYPDSFAEFRAIRKELYGRGYAVAGRPLPQRFPIGGSPHGSKSAAQ